MRTLHRINKGRFWVWWLTHKEQVRLMLTLGFLVLALGVVGRWDYEDQLEAEKLAHQQVQRQLAGEMAARKLPNTVYLLEARTAEEAQIKLAKIAGELDMERAKLKTK